jgi:uncharacterized protein (TIGR03435 family)
MGTRELPDGIDADNVTVAMLVQSAYGASVDLPTDDAVTGLPDWAKSDYFSVQAKMSADQTAAFAKLDKNQQRACRGQMLQALLADRLKLKTHRETREAVGYELAVTKGGPKMKEGEFNPDGPKFPAGRSTMRSSIKNGAIEVAAQLYPMQQLADFLTHSPAVGHRVVDKTGLTGKYSFTLTFNVSPGVGPADAAAPDDSAPSIFTALQEQLGLRLQRGTVIVDAIVVDHVEHPSEN